MAAMLRSSLFFALAISLAFHPSTATKSHRPIRKICSATGHDGLCISSLEADPRSSSGDLGVLTEIIVDLALSNGSDTFRFIDTLLEETKDEGTRVALYSCQTVYGIGAATLSRVLLNLENKMFIEAKKMIGSAGDVALQCDKFFGSSIQVSPLGKRNRMFEDLCSVALAIVNLIA